MFSTQMNSFLDGWGIRVAQWLVLILWFLIHPWSIICFRENVGQYPPGFVVVVVVENFLNFVVSHSILLYGFVAS